MDQKQIFNCLGARNWFLRHSTDLLLVVAIIASLWHIIMEARVEMAKGEIKFIFEPYLNMGGN